MVAIAGGAAPCPLHPEAGAAVTQRVRHIIGGGLRPCDRARGVPAQRLRCRDLAHPAFARTPDRPATVIAAGERWADGSLRPALEDLLGAGAVITAMHAQGSGPLSPEAEAARACYEATADVARAVTDSVSGRELAEGGFADDVAIATVVNSCAVTPVLADQAFTAAS